MLHDGTVKHIILVISLTAVSFSLAGELEELHNILARSSVVLECESPPVKPDNTLKDTEGVRRVTAPECIPLTSEPRVLEIGIERTTCLTSCPTYSFIVGLDGRFRYVGESGVDRIGVFTGYVDLGRFRQIRRFADELRVFDMPDAFPGLLDNPTTYLLINTGSTTKVIADTGLGSPAGLWALGQLIDSLLDSAIWD